MELKRIAPEAIPAALEKALRYRLLNEPLEAECICRDILKVQPDNQEALITLLLAITDEFVENFTMALDRAMEILPRLASEYNRTYYEGIIHERWGKAQLSRGMPEDFALSWIRKAMRCYERADTLDQPDDPDAALRWNTCARFLERRGAARPHGSTLTSDVEAGFGDDVPLR
jgi:hypothetical protein